MKTLSFCSSYIVKDQVQRPYTTAVKMSQRFCKCLQLHQQNVAIIPVCLLNFRLITASIAYAHNTQSAVIITALRKQQMQLIVVVAILFRQSQPQHTNKTQLCTVIFTGCNRALPVPEAARSKAWVCGR